MKKEDLRLKEMYDYIANTKLNINEAHAVIELQGNGKREKDIPYTYFAMKFIKTLSNRGYDITKLSKVFLNRCSDLSFEDVTDLTNIMYFKEDLGMNDCYKAMNIFYDFFNDDVNYDNDRLNTIKDYITLDNDSIGRTFRTMAIIDINLLTGNNDDMFFEYYKNIDASILSKFFEDNKIKYDETFNKNMFKNQLSCLRFYYDQMNKERVK